MPCNDNDRTRPAKNEPVRVENVRTPKKENSTQNYKGAFCALMNALSEELTPTKQREIIQQAAQHGGINIYKLWEEHLREDKKRIVDMYNNLSFYEKEILHEIVNND